MQLISKQLIQNLYVFQIKLAFNMSTMWEIGLWPNHVILVK